MRNSSCYIVLIFFLICSASYADYHSAPLSKANWEMNASSSYCELKQKIPSYGIADFTLQSGELLRFSIREDRLNPAVVKASLTVESPPWRHDVVLSPDYRVTLEQSIDSQKYSRLSVYGTTAEIMLTMLANGLFPQFDYVNSSVNKSFPETRVAVSAVNFITKYQQFIDCRKDFLPHGFKDRLAKSLFFKSSSKQLTSSILQQLNNTAKYIKEVKGARVVVASDTVIAGKRDKKWFSKRADLIVSQLKACGVPKNKISINAGELAEKDNKTIRLSVFGPDALRSIYYRKGNVNLTQIEMQRLDLIVRYMQDFLPNGRVIIKSHTDSKGSRANNLKVSQKRGDVIKHYLVSKGLAETRIKVKAYGESKPVRSNRFPTGRAQNRRVIMDFVS